MCGMPCDITLDSKLDGQLFDFIAQVRE